jgi:tetratricopeptide (TPR) repeat protein
LNQANHNFDRLLSAATDALGSGQIDIAAQAAEQALALNPESVAAKYLVGVTAARRREHDLAAKMLSQVLEADPNFYEAVISLATIFRETGNHIESVALSKRGITIRPNDPQAHNNLGRSLLSARNLDEAANSFGRAIAIQPKYSVAYYNLGKTRQLQGRDGEAAEAFSNAARLSPTPENVFAYGHMLLTLCNYDAAVDCGSWAVSQFPNSAAAHLLLCGALTETSQIEQAEFHLKRAIELDPEGKEALQTAVRQRPLGYISEANENLRRVLMQNPRQISAFDSLMQNQKVTEDDRGLVDRMRGMLSEDALSQTELVSIHYGLGKALEDLKDYEESMHHYDEANRITRLIKFGSAPFDRTRYVRHVDHLLSSFGVQRGLESHGAASELPLIVIGMMRSGTSLTEQIISSHPDVAGAGEQLFWSRNWQRALSPGDALNQESLSVLGDEYVEHLRTFGPDAKRITDKMPGNYMFAGLLNLALPNARIVHIRRSPIDTCLSIWATPNHMPHDGGNNKGDIAFVYEQYMRLMEHWRAILPSDRFFEVDYEALVSKPEETIRALLEFCGLDWNESCLYPQENKRLVATPSAWQVRQPLYRTSVERWRKFETCLGEFEPLLHLQHPQTPPLP